MTAITLIDNYDSFTFNVFHALGALGTKVAVHRNDKVTVDEILAARPDAIVISPGPCTPREAGISLDLVRRAAPTTPVLGICLGMQAIGEAFGGKVVRADELMHGKVSTVSHDGRGLFQGIAGPFRATRYHSLVVERESLPDALAVTAESERGTIMGLSHRTLPVHGVQFHPESIASEEGTTVFANFLALAAAWNAAHRAATAGAA
ncbi:MAG TPA: aminodeoxychorismate/anthranilate synthase component II [Hyphomicrobiales bacterium]|nr:aminodeoxychorismate/anthranilate synthase component II [Hyphomicrobiales bacterium]